MVKGPEKPRAMSLTWRILQKRPSTFIILVMNEIGYS